MTISIWRYSHLTLAISSALFIIIASLTGIILAFEPISNKLKPYSIDNIEQVSIAETIEALQAKYEEVITVEIDENDFVLASVITKEGKSETFYINPKTGGKVGNSIEKAPVFEFATNLHRSLFLKSTGRFLIGFVSFLLFLIAITGVILISKRQGGFHKIFSKIVKEDFNQYYHIIFGRWFLIPIIIITLTGVYLSLEKFSLLPKENQKHQILEINKTSKNLNIADFEYFKNTKLSEITKIEFPFSSDEEDYFFVKTIDNEFAIHQFNGQIISQEKKSLTALGSHYSLILHTGKGSILWSIALLLTCIAILFFIFSGFSMTLKRRKHKTTFTNIFKKDEVEYIVLVGSETGSTNKFSIVFFNALLKADKKVYISELNDYTTYKKAKHIIVFTATYGDGDAPINANKFLSKSNTVTQNNTIKFSVVGFGSTNYPEFCKFAILVHANLQLHEKFIPFLPLFKVDNQSFSIFKKWTKEWSENNQIKLSIDKRTIKNADEKKLLFEVVHKSKVNIDDTFLIELKPAKKIKFTSGDLLSIIPKNETKNRLYSIAKIDKNILLSVKKHELGLCSNYLNSLNRRGGVLASIQKNENFHFSKKVREVVLIGNGTGIAPFLGMIQKNRKKKKIHLFWGGRTKESFKIYQKLIDKSLNNKQLTSFHSVFSQEQKEKKYVQDILKNHINLIVNTLKNGNIIMICGSLSMQKGVEKVISKITESELEVSLDRYKENHQIKADCY